ncbi:hypothetical protein TNCV_1702091 [Trichonephila clavipes]|nr:hypothetical protein TNCV_1702091 [Trichonephila clavipes]
MDVQRLNEYYFDIRHRKGSLGNADALSRRPCPEIVVIVPDTNQVGRTSRLIVLQPSSMGPLDSLYISEWCSIPKIQLKGWKDIQVAISTPRSSYPRGTRANRGIISAS